MESQKKTPFKPIQDLGRGGIYTAQEIQNVQRLFSFGSERQAVTSILTRRIGGREADAQGYNTIALFSGDELKQLAYTTGEQVWGWLVGIGNFTSGFLGLYMGWRIIKYGLDVTLNAMMIQEITGGRHILLAGLWGSLTNQIIHRQHHRTNRPTDIETNVQGRAGASHENERGTQTLGTPPLYPPLTITHTE